MSQTWPVTLVDLSGVPSPYVESRGSDRREITVHLQALDGSWEVCGADRARGVWPENVKPITSDEWGSKTVSFDLRRDPKAVWPDIGAFTPVKIDIGGVLRWKGRVKQTPTRDDLDSVINVQCEGMQAHLDDDVFERKLVHTRLSDWQDVRSHLTADLSEFIQAGSVGSEHGIVLAWPKDAVVPTNKSVAVGIDLGPGNAAKRVVVTLDASMSDTGQSFDCRGSDTGFVTAGSQQASGFSTAFGTGASSGTSYGSFPSPHRFVWLLLYQGNAGSITPAADNTVRITSIQVFADTAYESGNASVLKSDVVVKDALDRATILLNADRSGIDAGSFNIPEFAPAEPRTPRQVWEAVDAFEDRLKRIDLQDRPVYTAKPTAPAIEVGAWSAMTFEDASANDGAEVYERVVVKGTQPDGSALRVERTQAQQPGVALAVPSSPAPTNPGFETDTTGWTATGSTITRDTGQHDSGSASGRWDNTGASDNLNTGDTLEGTFSGTFLAGVPYTLRFSMRASASAFPAVGFGSFAASDFASVSPSLTGGAWSPVEVTWVPKANRTSVSVKLMSLASRYYHIDSLAVYVAAATIVARRSFRRTKVLDVSFALTPTSAAQIGDLFLRAHQRTPFKGTVRLTGHGAVRDVLSGTPLPVDALLDQGGQLLRFMDRIDPDTGAVGRAARIAEVSVDPETDEAVVTLDNSRAGFDALLSRLDLVLGQRA